MENQIEIYKHPKFGEIRCMKDDRGDPWFIGKDVAVMLNYTNPSKAVRDHVDFEDKLSERIVLSGQHREVCRFFENQPKEKGQLHSRPILIIQKHYESYYILSTINFQLSTPHSTKTAAKVLLFSELHNTQNMVFCPNT